MPGAKELDCTGLACPQPVINTKKALEAMSAGGTLITLVDNDTARENVTLFARNAGYQTEVEKMPGGYRITITGTGTVTGEVLAPRQEKPSGQTVYFITSNLLGQGSPDLGQVLMKSLFVTLKEMDPLPKALLFLNSGVMLACEGSPVMEQLQSLHSRGVAVVSCGTCLEYYKLKDKLKTGSVSNMLEISSYMSGNARVITIA